MPSGRTLTVPNDGCDTGCGGWGGWARERLPDPVHQYYYVYQGPTYTGPGNWAPRPVYREGAISGYGYGYNRPYRYRAYRTPRRYTYHRYHRRHYRAPFFFRRW